MSGIGGDASFPCIYNGPTTRPVWIINSTVYSSHHLPENHHFDGTVLTVTNIRLEQNNTIYQCRIDLLHEEGVFTLCEYTSTAGRLIIQISG